MSGVRILATPQEALVDEKIHIKVDGLPRNGAVTIKASLQEGKQRFSSFGCYTATDQGHVIVENQSSVQGTYTGVEPMGLFWSMKHEPLSESKRENVRLNKRDVTTPLVVTLSVLEGHHSWGSLFYPPPEPLTTLDLYRWYKHKHVRRERVRHGNVRGVLFTPPGPGPFPGVIDIFGSGGGLPEYRAALLASRGFSVFALPYFAYEDLPASFAEVSLDYFIESTKWFAGLPHIKNDGIGIIGMSKGGMYALELCRRVPQVKAAVLVNGTTFYSDAPLKFSGGDIENAECRLDKFMMTSEGVHWTELYQPSDENYIRAWESEANVLCIVGEDDRCISQAFSERFMELIPEEHKHRFQLIKYPNAGHLIEHPYTPHCRISFHKVYGYYFLYGGETNAHSYAQEDSWRRILEFLYNQLKCDKPTGHTLQTDSKL